MTAQFGWLQQLWLKKCSSSTGLKQFSCCIFPSVGKTSTRITWASSLSTHVSPCLIALCGTRKIILIRASRTATWLAFVRPIQNHILQEQARQRNEGRNSKDLLSIIDALQEHSHSDRSLELWVNRILSEPGNLMRPLTVHTAPVLECLGVPELLLAMLLYIRSDWICSNADNNRFLERYGLGSVSLHGIKKRLLCDHHANEEPSNKGEEASVWYFGSSPDGRIISCGWNDQKLTEIRQITLLSPANALRNDEPLAQL